MRVVMTSQGCVLVLICGKSAVIYKNDKLLYYEYCGTCLIFALIFSIAKSQNPGGTGLWSPKKYQSNYHSVSVSLSAATCVISAVEIKGG